jgi:hypothetical protein
MIHFEFPFLVFLVLLCSYYLFFYFGTIGYFTIGCSWGVLTLLAIVTTDFNLHHFHPRLVYSFSF